MRREIPARIEIFCDCCKRQMGVNGATNRLAAKFKMDRNALDFQGNACASAAYSFDLCDGCEQEITKAINAVAESQRAKHQPAPSIA